MKNVLIAALLGALTVFLCGFVVYGVLGLHLKTVSSFENSSAVATMLKANAPEAGMYFRPSPGYGCRVLMVAALGVFAGLVDPILNWNWMGDAISFSFFTAGQRLTEAWRQTRAS